MSNVGDSLSDTAVILRDVLERSGILSEQVENTCVNEPSTSKYTVEFLTPEVMRKFRRNANLPELLSVRVSTVTHSGLRCFEGRRPLIGDAASLRAAQNRRLAMSHVERGAELTRSGKCFEAIQCFNRAINVDESCADAFVGRGAACAGSNNFPAALTDLEKALGLEPEHKNAKCYRIEVLIAYGKDLEKEGQPAEAYDKYLRALKFADGMNERAANALQRLSAYGPVGTTTPKTTSKSLVEVVDLAEDEEDHEKICVVDDKKETQAGGARKRKLENGNSSEHESGRESFDSENRRKLREMQSFIEHLKKFH